MQPLCSIHWSYIHSALHIREEWLFLEPCGQKELGEHSHCPHRKDSVLPFIRTIQEFFGSFTQIVLMNFSKERIIAITKPCRFEGKYRTFLLSSSCRFQSKFPFDVIGNQAFCPAEDLGIRKQPLPAAGAANNH